MRPELEYLWSIFLDINCYDGVISYQEISSYTAVNGELEPFEIHAIRRLSRIEK